jgi:hypothetical protein
MKKTALIAIMALCACNNTVEPRPGAGKLTVLLRPSSECEFLYELNADAKFYSEADAMRYIENSIADKSGNAYWIKTKERRQNEWKPFAPEYSYAITANVYDCSELK